MSSIIKKALIRFIIPLIAIIILMFINPIAGVAAVIIYIMVVIYAGRVSLLTFIGGVSYSKNGIDGALKWYKRACKTGKARPRTMISYAYLLLKAGNIVESETILNKLLESNINSDDKMYAKSNLALILWKKGNLDDAVTMLEEVINEFKTSTVYGSLGYLSILKGDLDKALAFNLEAYEYNSSNAVILDNLGQTYYLKGEDDKAEEIFEKLMASNPGFPEAYYNYGLVLLRKGDPERAIEVMQKALNYKLSFLSAVTREEIELKIKEIESIVKSPGLQE